MKFLSTICLLLLLVLWSSCRSDFETVETTGGLEFSRDTVFLDTIFSNTSTSTYSLKVYNRRNEDIYIPEISLALGETSEYRLNVDGMPGKFFEDVEILANDSIYIFIETTVDAQQEQNVFLYQDFIRFKSSGHLQEVPLITLVKDAVFLFPAKGADGFPETIPLDVDGVPQTVQGFYLSEENLHFTNAKPYVIYGYAVVPSGKTLSIEAGSRVHFHEESGIMVSQNASLQVNGKYSKDRKQLENEVIFEGARLEAQFGNIPGQWGMIWLREGSKNHHMNYATIKNSGIGLFVEGSAETSNPLQLSNTQIYNSAVNGIRAVRANISGENLVINNSGRSSLHLIGGQYDFDHCTFVNYWRQGYRADPAVFIENILIGHQKTQGTDISAEFSNSIIFGNENLELLFNKDDDYNFDIFFQNTLIKFNDPKTVFSNDPLYNFDNTSIYEEVILNKDPLFVNPQKNLLRLKEGSPVIDQGNVPTALKVPFDLRKIDRTVAPDFGAYEWVPISEGTGEK